MSEVGASDGNEDEKAVEAEIEMVVGEEGVRIWRDEQKGFAQRDVMFGTEMRTRRCFMVRKFTTMPKEEMPV